MKKMLALACALMLLCACAAAETKQSTIMMEGMPEEITLTRYQGDGFSLWYEADKLNIEHVDRGAGSERFVPMQLVSDTDEVDFTFYKEASDDTDLQPILTKGLQALEQEGFTAYEIGAENLKALNGRLTMVGYYGVKGDAFRECYVALVPGGLVYITIRYTMDYVEGWADRFQRMVMDME